MGNGGVDVPPGRPLHEAIADCSPDLLIATTVDGVHRFVSATGLAPFGWEVPDLIALRQEEFVHPDDVGLLVSTRDEVSNDTTRAVTSVFRLRCADGTFRWVEALSRQIEEGGEVLILSAVRDIRDRRQSEIDLYRQATTDPLTGVANRTVFMDRLHQALRRLERADGLVAVLYLDLDRFKLINDSVGHLMGDAILLQMAERLRSFMRPHDTLARLGGDEFAIVVEDLVSAEQVVALGQRIIEAGRAPFVEGDESFICTTSVGIATTTDPQHSAEALLQEADLALYRAKGRGRDRAEMFDEDLRTRAVGRLATERMLRRAVDEDRLRVTYQPIVDLATGNTVSAEALVRVWDPDQAQLIPAHAFIEVAEEAGLLTDIDDWVMAQAIDQASVWQKLFAATGFTDVTVNITARHLADQGFAQSVVDSLASHGLPSGALQIEVTEHVLMEASHSAMTSLRLLRDAGVKVGLDDFGTGYSSLSYLRLFPLDFVKIDQSFIQELALGPAPRAIVASIIELSHALGMAVVAEGVETQSQLDRLAALGCDRAQGFVFAASGPPSLIEDRVLRAADLGPGRI